MEILVNSRGQRVFGPGQPYIDQAELHRNVQLFNNDSWNTGLYGPPRPDSRKDLAGRTCCGGWLDYFDRESPSIPPQKGNDKRGNTYLFGYPPTRAVMQERRK